MARFWLQIATTTTPAAAIRAILIRVTLAGHAEGGLGFGNGEGRITLRPTSNGGTTIHYVYEAGIGGKVASIGGRLLDGAARVIIGQFFAALARQAGGGSERASLLAKLSQWFGGQG